MRILVAGWDSGGGVEAVQKVVRRAVGRAGAGLRVSRKAKADDLRTALGRVLGEPRFRTAARRMAATLAAERDEGLVVDELERAALEHPAVSH